MTADVFVSAECPGMHAISFGRGVSCEGTIRRAVSDTSSVRVYRRRRVETPSSGRSSRGSSVSDDACGAHPPFGVLAGLGVLFFAGVAGGLLFAVYAVSTSFGD